VEEEHNMYVVASLDVGIGIQSLGLVESRMSVRFPVVGIGILLEDRRNHVPCLGVDIRSQSLVVGICILEEEVLEAESNRHVEEVVVEDCSMSALDIVDAVDASCRRCLVPVLLLPIPQTLDCDDDDDGGDNLPLLKVVTSAVVKFERCE
jgi:hypothetical protein